MLRLLAIAIPAFALDQFTKYLVAWYIPFDPFHGTQEPVVSGFFYLVHWGNTGAAFSFMSGHSSFFVALSVLATVVLFVLNRRGVFRDALSRWGAGLLLGGIFGNVTDRITHGHVIDFLLFYLRLPFANPWPAFNVADSCICVAVGLFLISSFREERAKVKAAPEQPGS